MAYSNKIRLCTGNSDDPMKEPGPYSWDNGVSLSDGHATITKCFNFTTKSNGIIPREVCPSEVIRAKGFPVKYDKLEEDERYVYYGNGNLEHLQSDSRFWVYRAEYTTNKERGGYNDRKPYDVSISFMPVTKPFTAAFDRYNKRYTVVSTYDGYIRKYRTNPVQNTARDPITAETTILLPQINFSFNLSPKSFNRNSVLECVGSVNIDSERVIGLTIPAGAGRIVTLEPSFQSGDSDATEGKKQFWVIKASILIDKSGDTLAQKLLNVGNRALFYSSWSISQANGIVSGSGISREAGPVYSWWSWDPVNGQLAANSRMQFGNRAMLIEAKSKYDKMAFGRNLNQFAYETLENVPLLPNGQVNINAMDSTNDNFGNYISLEFPEFPKRNWGALNMPEEGVDW